MGLDFGCEMGSVYWHGRIVCFLWKVQKTIYWAIDFVPKDRFTEGIKNKIYHFINVRGYKNADEMWDLGVRMAEAREKFLDFKKGDYRKHRVVPYGMWTEEVQRYSFAKCEQKTLVFMGHLLEKQGVQLVIRAMPQILKRIPDFRFKIIGAGPYQESLKKLAQEKNVSDYCNFLGKIDDIRELENEVAKSAIAIAPYIKELDTWTYYTDPGKVKTYVACGVPILLTNVPWNAEDLQKNECGFIISEDRDNLVKKIVELLQEEKNQEFRENCKKYAKTFDYNSIFSQIF